MQEHSPKNVSTLLGLIKEKNIPIETPVLEGKEYEFCGGKIQVIGPTKEEMLKVAEKIEQNTLIKEHAAHIYTGDIKEVKDKYQPDSSDSNRASIIMVIEFENKKLLFTGDSAAESIVRAVDMYCMGDVFDVVKLPHHGSVHNISRELLRKLKTDRFIISTNKYVEKAVMLRFAEERKSTELLCNYRWWSSGYFSVDDKQRYIDTGRIIMKYIGEDKIILQ